MPFDFAARLFDATRLGMRVIVAPSDVVPSEVAHPALFRSKPHAVDFAAARAAEADEAARKADQARLAAVTASREAAREMMPVRVVAAAREVASELAPVSVFISRKTQRLYVRRAFQPILETSVTILDADRPMGTHVFTALERTNGDSDMRGSVVSLDGGRKHSDVVEPHGRARGGRGRYVEPMLTDPGGAKTALDRIVIPQDALDRISAMASPRSSLIISDEELSSETDSGTDFVVLLSGEPQGAIKIRQRGPGAQVRYERLRDRMPPGRSPFAAPYSNW
jgi:hypothetical protein